MFTTDALVWVLLVIIFLEMFYVGYLSKQVTKLINNQEILRKALLILDDDLARFQKAGEMLVGGFESLNYQLNGRGGIADKLKSQEVK